MMLVDSGVWIGWLITTDKWHKQSKKIIERLASENIDVGVTDHVIDEVYNYVLKRISWEKAQEITNAIKQTSALKIFYTSELVFNEALSLTMEEKKLSVTDAIQVVHARDEGIKEIASFDKAFDKLRGIKRITK